MSCQTDFSTVITAAGNITCKRADTFSLEFEMLYADDQTPCDLSGYDSIIMSVKASPKDSTYVLQFTTADTTFVVNGSRFTLFKAADKMNIEAKGYVYDMQGTKGTVITTIAAGSFTVLEDVTRTTDTP